MRKINPFRPGSPVVPGMFVGRLEEVERIEDCLFQTRADRSSHFMLTGERGIGKTSLLLYVRYIATRQIDVEGEWFNFLVADIDISASTSQLDLIKRVELALKRQLSKDEKVREFFGKTWGFLKRVEIADSRLRDESRTINGEVLLDEFAYSLASVVERTCGEQNAASILSATYDGILILLDEVDNSPKDLQLGAFLKLLLERIQRQACNRVMVGLAGLPESREVLRKSHASSVRIFDELLLNRLSTDEVSSVIDRCLEEAEKLNGRKITITDRAREILIGMSEGYPHFIQQFGYSAFDNDIDDVIDEVDVQKSAFEPRGALDLIGDRYYRDNFYNKVQKESYRQVLRIMADKLDGWVNRAEIAERFKGKKTTLNNAIKALRDRHIILSKEGVRGVYRLQHKGFALWIKLYGTDPDTLQQELNFRQENGT
ncbi:MAG: AAA family ATPase [Sedimentisphaerales bacterium]|nr:AAA family ATPase [Sedimentisphaerales bacterium]